MHQNRKLEPLKQLKSCIGGQNTIDVRTDWKLKHMILNTFYLLVVCFAVHNATAIDYWIEKWTYHLATTIPPNPIMEFLAGPVLFTPVGGSSTITSWAIFCFSLLPRYLRRGFRIIISPISITNFCKKKWICKIPK